MLDSWQRKDTPIHPQPPSHIANAPIPLAFLHTITQQVKQNKPFGGIIAAYWKYRSVKYGHGIISE
jgi:hypothetical protein